MSDWLQEAARHAAPSGGAIVESIKEGARWAGAGAGVVQPQRGGRQPPSAHRPQEPGEATAAELRPGSSLPGG